MEPIERALLSLDGLSVGDALGERFFGFTSDILIKIQERKLPKEKIWRYTDDTEMSLSLVWNLWRYGEINSDIVVNGFVERFDERRGYGGGARRLLASLRQGASWRIETPKMFGGEGSYGNGAAMRVAPVGAFFADDLDAVKENAKKSALPTHTHIEAINGAIAVAIAAAIAWNNRNTRITSEDFMEQILPFLSDSLTKDGIMKAIDLPKDTTIRRAAYILGSGSNVSAQDTVPFVLWSASHHLNSYEEAFWATVEGLGDRDTTCAMVGGIVALSADIPKTWLERREPFSSNFQIP